MKKTITLILLLFLCLFSFKLHVEAKSANLVNIYFFHSNSCSHCKEETKFLEKIIENYSNVKIYKYEIHDKDAKEVLKKASNIYNIKTNGVPITIIGNKVYTGFLYEKSSLKFIKTIEYTCVKFIVFHFCFEQILAPNCYEHIFTVQNQLNFTLFLL